VYTARAKANPTTTPADTSESATHVHVKLAPLIRTLHVWRRWSHGVSPYAHVVSAGVAGGAVELARQREKPVAQIAKDLGTSERCLRRWMDRAAVDDGVKPGLSDDERKELAWLCRRNRVLEIEIEILKSAGAYFARENLLPT